MGRGIGSDTPEEIADDIHSALGGDPPIDGSDPTQTDDWELLDGSPYQGECDEQARFMIRVLNLLGLSGSERKVRASTDAGAGNCLNFELRTCPAHRGECLLLDFYGGGTLYNMNAYEACCETASHYYAVWPIHKATNDYTMLQTLGSAGVTQHWCYYDWVPALNNYWWYPCDQPGSTPSIP